MIYFDNAATTWPKPERVYKAMDDCMRKYAANPGRSGHKMALMAAREIYETRLLLAEFFNIDDAMQIVFTANATESLNLALKGALNPGDHVIISSMEHNSVVRPLKALEALGVEMSIAHCDEAGRLDINSLKSEIKPNTRMLAITHISNLTGTIMPVSEIGRLAAENKLLFLLDASQSAGVYNIDVKKHNIDLLAAPGHKGLYGPQGTGFLYIRPGLDLKPLKQGGTGSKSAEIIQPELMPDRYESGTLNTSGIAGLRAGLEFINELGRENICKYEEELTAYLLSELKQIKGLILYGPKNIKEQAAVIAFNFEGLDCSEAAYILDSRYDIYCRSGLHCSPLAHKTIKTQKKGALRFSLSYFNTEEEITAAVSALKKIAGEGK